VLEPEQVRALVQEPVQEPVQVPEQVRALVQEPVQVPEQVQEPVREQEPPRRIVPNRGRARGAAFTRPPRTWALDLGHSTSLRMTLGICRIRGWKL
jgi:hypothetical protein